MFHAISHLWSFLICELTTADLLYGIVVELTVEYDTPVSCASVFSFRNKTILRNHGTESKEWKIQGGWLSMLRNVVC